MAQAAMKLKTTGLPAEKIPAGHVAAKSLQNVRRSKTESLQDLPDVDIPQPITKLVRVLGGHCKAVYEPSEIRPTLDRAREAVSPGKPALVNIRVDPNAYAPRTMNQTIYK